MNLEDLKCCGNCLSSRNADLLKKIQLFCLNHDMKVEAYKYCDSWIFDTIPLKARKYYKIKDDKNE